MVMYHKGVVITTPIQTDLNDADQTENPIVIDEDEMITLMTILLLLVGQSLEGMAVILVVVAFILHKTMTVVIDLIMEQDVETTMIVVAVIVTLTTVENGIVMIDEGVTTRTAKTDIEVTEVTEVTDTEMTEEVNAATEIDTVMFVEVETEITTIDEGAPAGVVDEAPEMPIGRSKQVRCLWHMLFRIFRRKVPDMCARKPKNGLLNEEEEPCNCQHHLLRPLLMTIY